MMVGTEMILSEAGKKKKIEEGEKKGIIRHLPRL